MDNNRLDLSNLMSSIFVDEFYFELDCKPTFDPLFESVICYIFGVTKQGIRSKSRKQSIVFARNICIYYLYRNTNNSLRDIAEVYEKTHTAVRDSKNSHEKLIISNHKKYRDHYNEVKLNLNIN